MLEYNKTKHIKIEELIDEFKNSKDVGKQWLALKTETNKYGKRMVKEILEKEEDAKQGDIIIYLEAVDTYKQKRKQYGVENLGKIYVVMQQPILKELFIKSVKNNPLKNCIFKDEIELGGYKYQESDRKVILVGTTAKYAKIIKFLEIVLTGQGKLAFETMPKEELENMYLKTEVDDMQYLLENRVDKKYNKYIVDWEYLLDEDGVAVTDFKEYYAEVKKYLED